MCDSRSDSVDGEPFPVSDSLNAARRGSTEPGGQGESRTRTHTHTHTLSLLLKYQHLY